VKPQKPAPKPKSIPEYSNPSQNARHVCSEKKLYGYCWSQDTEWEQYDHSQTQRTLFLESAQMFFTSRFRNHFGKTL